MKTTKVKSHYRKGKKVAAHSRKVSGNGSVMSPGMKSASMKKKCLALKEKYGEDSAEYQEAVAKMKKHSRGMRKAIDKEVLVKESKNAPWKKKVRKGMKDHGMSKKLKGKKLTDKNPIEGTAGKTKGKLLRAIVARNSPSISKSHDTRGKRIGLRKKKTKK